MPTPRSLRSTTCACGAAWTASKIDRDDLPRQAPRALEEKARIRWLRAVEQVTSPRDRCIALIPYYAGARISEVVRLDVGDVRRSARKGVLRIYGKGDKGREVPIHAKLRPGLEQWPTERAAWPGAETSPALFLNTKGGCLSARAAGGIIATIAAQAALDDDPTAHVLRHTFATSLRGKTDLGRGRRAHGALPPGHHPAVQQPSGIASAGREIAGHQVAASRLKGRLLPDVVPVDHGRGQTGRFDTATVPGTARPRIGS